MAQASHGLCLPLLIACLIHWCSGLHGNGVGQAGLLLGGVVWFTSLVCRIFDERWRMSGRTPTTTPSAVAATMSGVSFARSTSTCAEHVGSQTFARWRHAAVQAGYRKGLNDLSEAQLQEGFDKGFATGFDQAVDAGRLLGVCRSLRPRTHHALSSERPAFDDLLPLCTIALSVAYS